MTLLPSLFFVAWSARRRVGSRANPSSAPTAQNRMAHMVHPTLAAYRAAAPALEPEGWEVRASSESAEHPARAVLDDEVATYWSSKKSSSGTIALPQSITIDMRGPQIVSGVDYQPREGTRPAGAIGRFDLDVSSDGVHFTTAASGTWANTTATQHIGIAPVTTRFVRLTARSLAASSGDSVAAAGITLQGASVVQSPPTEIPNLSTDPSVVGQWGPTVGFPLVPVAAAVLPNNKLLVWSADQSMNYQGGAQNLTQTAILDLATGQVSQQTITNTNHDMFCPGVAILPNGDIMVTGGTSSGRSSIYHVATNTWSAGPQMNVARGYQGQTLLSNGQVFTLGGSWSGGLGGKLGEVWSPTAGWRELTNGPATPIYTADPEGVYRGDNHGWFVATSGGKVFHAGPSKQMNWITTTGSGSITPAGLRGVSDDAMNGNAVSYDIGKILTLGGAPAYQNSNATDQANAIDIGNGTANVTQVGSMQFPRTFANSVALPNGEVLTVGGQTYAVPFSDDNSVLNPELWNPETGQFSVMAPEAVPRNYHSVAVLLPDGRVFSGGGGLCGTCSTNHPDGQIFSPPYLFDSGGTLRTRPNITSAPAAATTGQAISVTTDGPVSSFAMVRYGEATHSVDNDQRRVPLSIVSSSANTYKLAIPSDPGIALPGPYMLFALDANGTPSVSTTISINNVAAQPPANNYGRAVFNAGPSSYWPLDDASGPTATDASGNGNTGKYASTGIQYGASSPVENASGKGVALDGTGQIVASQPITNPTTYSEQMWFKTTTTKGGYLMGFGTSPSGTSVSKDRQVWMSDSGRLNFGIIASGAPLSIESPLAYNDGRWHQVVATQGPGGLKLYVDGQLANNKVTTSVPQNYLGYWRVGYEDTSGWNDSPTNDSFAGTMSDVAFYNVELSSAQVSAQYSQSGAGLPTSPTIATVAPGNGSATVVWTAPSSGSPIIGYVVTPYVGSTAQAARTFNSTATSQTITSLSNKTTYTFRVAAKNAVGIGLQSVASQAVTVGAPLAPTGIVATPGNGTVSLRWTAPAATNGSAISGYVVTPYVGSTAQTSRTFTSTATSQTITALTNATTYTFRVKAKNGNGVGPSGVSSPVTVGSPLAPTGVTGSGGNRQAIVQWTAPSSNNGAVVTGYVVTPYLGSTAQTAKTFDSTATTQTVTGLQNANTYTFVVAAKNARGVGPGSSASPPVNTAPLIKPGVGGVVESNSGTVPVNVPVTLSSAQAVPVTVQYATLDTGGAGIATAGADYVATSGTVTFAPGETSKTVPITVYGDTIKEPPAYLGEWIPVAFSNPTGGAVVDSSFYGLGIGIIVDDD